MSPTKALLEGLKAHYRKPGTDQDGEILVTEVTAPGSHRSCDLLRVGMWPSRGLGIDVHELKVSRSDWLRELHDPGKADAWWRYCSRFWIVATPGVVSREEMPKGWGLMLPPARSNARRFRVVVPAAEREPMVDLPLLVEILRRADNTRLAEMDQLRKAHRTELYTKVKAARRAANGEVPDSATRQKLQAVEELERVLGASIRKLAWGTDLPLEDITPEELVTAAREYTHNHVALQRRADDLRKQEERLRRGLERALRDLDPGPSKRSDAA